MTRTNLADTFTSDKTRTSTRFFSKGYPTSTYLQPQCQTSQSSDRHNFGSFWAVPLKRIGSIQAALLRSACSHPTATQGHHHRNIPGTGSRRKLRARYSKSAAVENAHINLPAPPA